MSLQHAPVLAEISFNTFKQHSFKRKIRNYNAADIEGLADQLNITNWDNLVLTILMMCIPIFLKF